MTKWFIISLVFSSTLFGQGNFDTRLVNDMMNQIQPGVDAPSTVSNEPLLDLATYLKTKYIGKAITVYKKDGKLLAVGYPVHFFTEKEDVFMELFNIKSRSKSKIKVQFVGVLNGLYRNQTPAGIQANAPAQSVADLEGAERLNVMIGPLLSGGSSVNSSGINVRDKIEDFPAAKAVSKTIEAFNVLNLATNDHTAIRVMSKNNRLFTVKGDPISIVFSEP